MSLRTDQSLSSSRRSWPCSATPSTTPRRKLFPQLALVGAWWALGEGNSPAPWTSQSPYRHHLHVLPPLWDQSIAFVSRSSATVDGAAVEPLEEGGAGMPGPLGQ